MRARLPAVAPHHVDAADALDAREDAAGFVAMVRLHSPPGRTVTADHPFWGESWLSSAMVGRRPIRVYVDAGPMRKAAGWVEAGHLLVCDKLRTASGRDVTVTGVRYNVGQAAVYTLTVGADRTFFVDEARVLVHNSTSNQFPRPPWAPSNYSETKPPYGNPGHHDTSSPKYIPGKTLLPADAEEVYNLTAILTPGHRIEERHGGESTATDTYTNIRVASTMVRLGRTYIGTVRPAQTEK